ncbi:MAG TPA: hypothetical protein DEP05_05820 [Betaproteobacteria bacterium]|nr:hypothetical protein [Betaproteobacteria bacterium]
MSLHPATKILLWLSLVLAIPQFRPDALLVLTGALLPALQTTPRFIKLLRRTRWLLLSLFLVYALTTPGHAVLPAFASLSPTREGLVSGGLQLWRLVLILASLALLFAACSRNCLLTGLLVLLRPLQWLGFPANRFAARIWLTLGYAESAPQLRFAEWRRMWGRDALSPWNEGPAVISLDIPHLAWRDAAMLAIVAALLTGMMWL